MRSGPLTALALVTLRWRGAAADGSGGGALTAKLPLHLVVPCYNEAARLPAAAFLEYAEAHPNTEFTFVNDGSTDGTLPMLQTLAAQRPEQLHVLDLVSNRGKAEATRLGMLAVLGSQPDGRSLLVGFWDGDLVSRRQICSHDAYGRKLHVCTHLLSLNTGDPTRRRG